MNDDPEGPVICLYENGRFFVNSELPVRRLRETIAQNSLTNRSHQAQHLIDQV
jgi:hypothetical protein